MEDHFHLKYVYNRNTILVKIDPGPGFFGGPEEVRAEGS